MLSMKNSKVDLPEVNCYIDYINLLKNNPFKVCKKRENQLFICLMELN